MDYGLCRGEHLQLQEKTVQEKHEWGVIIFALAFRTIDLMRTFVIHFFKIYNSINLHSPLPPMVLSLYQWRIPIYCAPETLPVSSERHIQYSKRRSFIVRLSCNVQEIWAGNIKRNDNNLQYLGGLNQSGRPLLRYLY